ncbi:MAG: sigma-70 family RNA polymerase sigma factor, partial [Candidatus Poribacteria bacterium]|nr:sigma-70 family RNA polymerase sigma factor [Candidatus Poribacteria bacterium]
FLLCHNLILKCQQNLENIAFILLSLDVPLRFGWHQPLRVPDGRSGEEEPMKPLDVDLVKGAQNGDHRAFEKLFLSYQKRVYNLAYRMTGNDADAADLTQETFLRAYQSIARIKNAEAFSTWLFRIAVNLCKNHRKAKHASLGCDSLDQFIDENRAVDLPTMSESPETAFEKDERDGQIQQALNALSDAHRTVVVLHHLEGVSLADIAKMLNCRVGTVKSRLARARLELKSRLRPYVES